jgi:hypothetical protein
MILYQVRLGVITVISVLRETTSGWRKHNGGFIKRSVLSEKHPSLTGWYYTTDSAEALQWSRILHQKMHDYCQAALASRSDIECWLESYDENTLPKSRV